MQRLDIDTISDKLDQHHQDDEDEHTDLLELIMRDIGGTFKKFQIINYILFCLPFALSGSFGLSYVFTALNVEYRCLIPECETRGTDAYNASWLRNAVPFSKERPSACYRYARISNKYTADQCTENHFNRSKEMRCTEYVYKTDEVSILNDFHFECDDDAWKLAMVGTANNVGRFIFMPMMGLLSDRFGRRTILIIGVLGSATFAFIRAFASNYLTYILFEFLDSGIGSVTYSASFILAMEWVGVKDRVLLGSIMTATYPLGQVFLGVVARAVRNYRLLLQIIYAPGFLIIVYFWIAPESIRWLIVNRKKQHVLATLKRAERMNGLKLSKRTIDRIHSELSEQQINPDQSGTGHLFQFLAIFKHRALTIRFFICAFTWATNAFVSYGISLTSISLGGDKYVNFVVIALAGVPAMLFVYFLMELCGRRWTLFTSLLIGGSCIIASKLLPTYYNVLSITFFFVGKCFITVAFTSLYVYTSELWPTNIRHSMMGLCSTIGRFGAACAPLTPLLSQYFDILPYLTFGLTSLVASILILKLPETLRKKLPDTIEEAKQIGRDAVEETS